MSQAFNLRSALGLASWFGITFLAAAVGAVASIQAKGFYMKLIRPWWAPPSELFGPVWTVLYVLMGVAAWMIWERYGFSAGRVALVAFVLQLALNSFWTWVFFRFQLGAASFVEILLLWGVVLWTVIAFMRLRPLAGLLLTPYLAWTTFATILTWAIWRRNPDLL
jgi:tryptophan-rich sensory protein